MKTKIGVLSLILAAGVGETWLSIAASIVLLAMAVFCLGVAHE